MYTNAQILSAVLNKWGQPIVDAFLRSRLQSIGFLQNIESKVKATGWVSPNWTIMQDLTPFIESITGAVITPMLSNYLSQIDDDAIPKVAHDIVDNALKHGKLELLERKIILENSDLVELKNLLNYNLPLNKETVYEVKLNANS